MITPTPLLNRVAAGELDVAYYDLGSPDAEPVVLLHGFPYDVHSYSEVAPLLIDAGFRVLVPYLRELGERWARGDATVAQEHFASNLLRGRLLGLARSWDLGAGPRAVLACAEGELHDLPLVCFGLALRARGWRISYLGSDTPVASLVEAARTLEPEAVVVSGTIAGSLAGVLPRLREVALHAPHGSAIVLRPGGRQFRAQSLDGGLNLSQAVSGDEIPVRADDELGELLRARAVRFLDECPAHDDMFSRAGHADK